jgi:hypothetical protein
VSNHYAVDFGGGAIKQRAFGEVVPVAGETRQVHACKRLLYFLCVDVLASRDTINRILTVGAKVRQSAEMRDD